MSLVSNDKSGFMRDLNSSKKLDIVLFTSTSGATEFEE